MKTGFARICITPPLGVALSGYYEYRYAKGVLDDLYAGAVSFDDGEKKAVIIAVDIIMLSTEQCNYARKLISDRCGIEEEAIFINCSHTHTGPIIGVKKFANQKGDSEYDKIFFKSLADVAEKAFENTAESSFSVAEGKAEGLSFIRRFRMKNGRVQTNPGVDNPETDHALGTPNDTVKMLRIERVDGENYVFVNFGTHADTVGGELISGDWPAAVRDTVERTLDNTKCLFLLGAEGDVNHINTAPTEGERRGLDYDTFDGVPRGYAHTKHMGRKIAGEVIGMIDKAEPITADRIRFGSFKIDIPSNQDNSRLDEARKITELYRANRAHELPYENMELTTVVAEANRIVGLEHGPESFPFVLTALKIGDVTFAGLPGECFVEIGRKIEAEQKSGAIFVCCLTNGGDSYFPTSSAYDEGGYEARTSRLKKGGDKIIVDGMRELLSEIVI